jgi:transcription antitermination protein NusB
VSEPVELPIAARPRGAKPPSPRRRAREFLVQGLYQAQIAGQDKAAIQTQAKSVAGFSNADKVLYETLLAESLSKSDELQGDLSSHIDRPWSEVSPVERSVLLLAACELKFHLETPSRVIINEAIELAKMYGGVDGHKFVNGVLDKLALILRESEMR